ncbi:hypothetical protein ACB092_05G162100 [Castanea dentata]
MNEFTCFPYIKIPKASSVRVFQSIYRGRGRGRGRAEGFLPSLLLSFLSWPHDKHKPLILFYLKPPKPKPKLYPPLRFVQRINFNYTSQTPNNIYQVQEHMKFCWPKVCSCSRVSWRWGYFGRPLEHH